MFDLLEDCFECYLLFIYCVVDYFGLFIIKENRKEFKCYGVLFICMVLRVIYLEIVILLEIDFFLNVLRCFFSCRGFVC